MAEMTGVLPDPLRVHQSIMAVGSDVDEGSAQSSPCVPCATFGRTIGYGIVDGPPAMAGVTTHGGRVGPVGDSIWSAAAAVTVAVVGAARPRLVVVASPLSKGNVLFPVYMQRPVADGVAVGDGGPVAPLTGILVDTSGVFPMPAAQGRSISATVMARSTGQRAPPGNAFEACSCIERFAVAVAIEIGATAECPRFMLARQPGGSIPRIFPFWQRNPDAAVASACRMAELQASLIIGMARGAAVIGPAVIEVVSGVG